MPERRGVQEMKITLFRVLMACIGMVLLFLMFGANAAQAHSWYDPWCCNQKDCAPLNSTPRAVPGGYEVNGLVFGQKSLRESRDNRWHACIYNGKPRCLYAPMGF